MFNNCWWWFMPNVWQCFGMRQYADALTILTGWLQCLCLWRKARALVDLEAETNSGKLPKINAGTQTDHQQPTRSIFFAAVSGSVGGPAQRSWSLSGQWFAPADFAFRNLGFEVQDKNHWYICSVLLFFIHLFGIVQSSRINVLTISHVHDHILLNKHSNR